ncbi:MAG: alpha/beta fold hydrolase [Clostridia bacterium]|nr:alpha/beta fold hydrolase [Clostridia bacterium]
MTALYVLLGLLLGGVTVTFIGARYAYKKAFYADRSIPTDYYKGIDDPTRFPPTMRDLIDGMIALPVERVSIKSEDGLTLVGYYHHVADGAPVDILFHGFRSSWQRDMSAIVPIVTARGHNVLLVDQRAHGESEGRVISYGINESGDAARWVDYVIRRFGEDVRIVLVGISMGAATVICAAGRGLPDNVKAVVADSPFSSATDIICKVGSRGNKRAVPVISFFARLGARLFGGFSATRVSAKGVARNIKVPFLLIHGTADALVPYEMAVEIAATNPAVRFESFEGADHVASCLVDHERYTATVNEFLEDCRL